MKALSLIMSRSDMRDMYGLLGKDCDYLNRHDVMSVVRNWKLLMREIYDFTTHSEFIMVFRGSDIHMMKQIVMGILSEFEKESDRLYLCITERRMVYRIYEFLKLNY